MLSGNEIANLKSYYTASGFSEKNSNFMASSNQVVQKAYPLEEKVCRSSESAGGFFLSIQRMAAHSAAGRCLQVNWQTWSCDRTLPDTQGGVKQLKLAGESKSSSLSLSLLVSLFTCLSRRKDSRRSALIALNDAHLSGQLFR